jgi:CBS domain-containing protein
MKVQEVMTKDLRMVAPNATIREAAAEMRAHNVGFLPVCQGDSLLGVITDRDIVVECMATDANPADCHVSDHMTANPICIGPDAEVEKALELMAQEQIRRLCVLQDRRLVGVVALGDLAVQPLEPHKLAAAFSHIYRRTWHLGEQRVHV